jgi:hypothetical protein
MTMDSSEGCYLARGNAVFSSFPVLLEAARVCVYVCVFLRLFFARVAPCVAVEARIGDGRALLIIHRMAFAILAGMPWVAGGWTIPANGQAIAQWTLLPSIGEFACMDCAYDGLVVGTTKGFVVKFSVAN